MKIEKIEFKNINALRGEHTIDFGQAPFTTHSLFAITGPTGSGKSTILDVISLALFNNIPRLDKVSRSEIESKGAILTRNQKDAYAKVTYSCGKGLYTSHWSISTNRNGNLRDYNMELWDVAGQNMLDLKKSEVPGKNEELIGLSYDQFIKSVLLAQGEFAQFLQAKKSERGELLEKITGTGIYRKLGQLAYERHTIENTAIKQQLDTINIKSESLIPEEEYTENTAVLQEKEKQVVLAENQIEQLKKNIDLKDNIIKQDEAIAALQLKKAETTKALERFESERGVRLKEHERIAPLGDSITQWRELSEKKNEITRELHKNEETAKQLEAETGALKKSIFSFIHKETADRNIPGALHAFAKNVDELQKQLNDKRSRHKTITSLFESELKTVNFSIGKIPQDDLSLLENLADETSDQLVQLEAKLSDIDLKSPENERGRLTREVKQLHEVFRYQEKINQISERIAQFQQERKNLLDERKSLPEQIKDTRQKADLLTVKLENAKLEFDNQRLKASFKEHRLHLEDGSPCPLCGATEHPYQKDDLPHGDAGLKEAMAQADHKLQAVNKLNMQLQAKLEMLNETDNKLEQSMLYEQNNLKELKERAPFATGGEAFLNEETFKEKVKAIEEKLEDLNHFLKLREQHHAIMKGIPLLKELIEILKEGTALKHQRDDLFIGQDVYTPTQELQNRWTSTQEKRNAYDKNHEELTKKSAAYEKKLENIEKNLIPKVRALDFAGIPQAAQAILPHQIQVELRGEKEQLTGQMATLNASLNTLKLQLEELRKTDILKDRTTLLNELNENKQRLNELRHTNEKLRRRIENHNETLQEINSLKEEIALREKQIRRWSLLRELIGDATGKKFNEFAQDLTLSHLLRYGNRRLTSLSDRYLMDKSRDGEDDGLVAIDKHMGGQRRSVKTLSGGETFILSLSLALALSDLASKQVAINSLFIDEGFGTLDPETLDQTLDTLERLEAESSKTIGIISHVESLKERITAQIQLSRNGQGYSTLQIRG